MAIAYTNSYRNKGFPNEPDVGYRNFFIPRVEKTSKNEPAGRKSIPPKGRKLYAYAYMPKTTKIE